MIKDILVHNPRRLDGVAYAIATVDMDGLTIMLNKTRDSLALIVTDVRSEFRLFFGEKDARNVIKKNGDARVTFHLGAENKNTPTILRQLSRRVPM